MSVKINRHLVKVGADPEVFLKDKELGTFVSAIGFLPGTKSEPFKVKELGSGFCVQTDNVATEFNVPPVNNAYDMFENLQKIMGFINKITPDHLELALGSSAVFTEEECSHPDAMLSGCASDYNAWTMDVNPKADYSVTKVRAAAAHIHISYPDNNDETSMELIRALDLFAGVPSVILDEDKRRRALYGKAGCFRMCDWGVEYRVLGNFWLSDIDNCVFVFKAINEAIKFVNNGKTFTDEESLAIQTCINTNDRQMALDLIYKYELESVLPVKID